MYNELPGDVPGSPEENKDRKYEEGGGGCFHPLLKSRALAVAFHELSASLVEKDVKEEDMKQPEIGYFTLGMVATNCFYIRGTDEKGDDTKDLIFIDPADRGDYLVEKCAEKGFSIKAILLTHGHFDHIWGVEAMAKKSGARVYAAETEKRLLSDPEANLSADYGRPCTITPDVWVKDGEVLKLCGWNIKCIFTPGHTEGSTCFYFPEGGVLIAGDTLFEESVGRTDFPTGSSSALIRSIREKLFTLPEETIVYPGHGELTTIGHEKRYNPFAC